MNKAEVLVGIHQPNYFPWIGYFYKCIISDIFIFLDTVQFSKGSYQNRVKINTPQRPKWLTAPVNKFSKPGNLTKDITFSNTEWPQKHLTILKHNYLKSPFWDYYYEELFELYKKSKPGLSETNVILIKWIAAKLDISTRFLPASSTNVTEIEPTKRLVKLVKAVGGNVYVHGAGANNYQDNTVFSKNNIGLVETKFQHPEYKQNWGDAFVPGLSILDLLFNVGPEEKGLLKKSG